MAALRRLLGPGGAAVALVACAAAAPVGANGARVASGRATPSLAIVTAGGSPASGAASAHDRSAQTAIASADRSLAGHVVAPGETLWRISRTYNTTVATLASINSLDDPTQIQPGQRLRVPAPALAKPAPKATADSSAAAAKAKKGLRGGTSSPASPKPGAATSKRYALRWPVEGALTSRYGKRWGRNHDGVDIGAAKGTPITAAAAGEVAFAGKHGSYGNLVLIRHRGGLVTVYAHNQRNLVRKGQRVGAGQLIARVGQTGRTTGPHLHFEVRRGTAPQNPLRFLPP